MIRSFRYFRFTFLIPTPCVFRTFINHIEKEIEFVRL